MTFVGVKARSPTMGNQRLMRTVGCRLLQRKCVSEVLGVQHADVIIKRTKGRKPFAAGGPPLPNAPNFNFNISHEVPPFI